MGATAYPVALQPFRFAIRLPHRTQANLIEILHLEHHGTSQHLGCRVFPNSIFPEKAANRIAWKNPSVCNERLGSKQKTLLNRSTQPPIGETSFKVLDRLTNALG